MTIASGINKTRFVGSNSAGPFLFGFKFYQNEEINVVKSDLLGVETIFAEGMDYTLSGAGLETGGTINLSAILPTGEELIVYRVLDILQSTSFTNQGAFYPALHETAFDKLTMIVQQIAEETGRAIKLPVSHTGPFTMPGINRENTLMGFDSAGDPVLRAINYLTISSSSAGASVLIRVDASAGPVSFVLPESGEAVVIKTDSTENAVTITGLPGTTVLLETSIDLTVQGEYLRLNLTGSDWEEV